MASAQPAMADAVDDAIAAARKAPRNTSLARAAAEALRNAGRIDEAITYWLKSGNTGQLEAAEAAFGLYRFDDAAGYLDTYLSKRTKAEVEKEPTVTTTTGAEIPLSEWLSARIDLGRSMLDRVEKIQVIDSINVPAERFFRFMYLAREAGTLAGEGATAKVATDAVLDSLGLAYIDAPAYLTERGDELYWTGTDEEGRSAIFESSLLSDGMWDTPLRLFDFAEIFGNTSGQSVTTPFLMPDGVTLYFAADGDDSLGGLDIFISRRDSDGRFLQPSNIGMPYNSPANDYMYAIDEETGLGWWASDRSGLQDTVTIYTFIPQELRINYDVDTPGLPAYAALSSIKLSQPEGADYTALRRRVQSLADPLSNGHGQEGSGAVFDFAMPDGRIMHRLSDFRSSMARASMTRLLKARAEADADAAALAELRQRYSRGDRSVGPEILRRERQLETTRAELRDLANQVAAAE